MTNREKEEKRKSWKKHIRQWEKSGQSQIEYCRQHNLSDKCFYYWKNKYQLKDKSVSFVKLAIPESLPEEKFHSNNSLKIILDNNLKIEISDNFNPMTLKKAVETLRSIG